MSGDLISRAKAIAMHKAECSGVCDCCKYITNDLECSILLNVPDVDAEPVRHGRWAHLGGDEWCCTGCGEVIHTEGSWEQPTKKFCPNCGAKMDEEGEK